MSPSWPVGWPLRDSRNCARVGFASHTWHLSRAGFLVKGGNLCPFVPAGRDGACWCSVLGDTGYFLLPELTRFPGWSRAVP